MKRQFKRRLSLLVVLLIGLLMVVNLYYYSYEPNSLPDIDKNKLVACQIDSDCVKVDETCCPCNAGGNNIAINRRYLDDFNLVKQVECTGNFACAQVYQCADDARARCVENKCSLVKIPN